MKNMFFLFILLGGLGIFTAPFNASFSQGTHLAQAEDSYDEDYPAEEYTPAPSEEDYEDDSDLMSA